MSRSESTAYSVKRKTGKDTLNALPTRAHALHYPILFHSSPIVIVMCRRSVEFNCVTELNANVQFQCENIDAIECFGLINQPIGVSSREKNSIPFTVTKSSRINNENKSHFDFHPTTSRRQWNAISKPTFMLPQTFGAKTKFLAYECVPLFTWAMHRNLNRNKNPI